MSAPKDHITDEDLTAFLDGELSDPARARVEAAIASDPGVAGRLAGLDVPLDELRAGMDQVLAEVPPMAPLAKMPKSNTGWLVAAALAAGVLIGAGAFYALRDDRLPGWQDYAAAYHLLYRQETLAGIEPTAAEVERQLQAVSQRVSLDLTGAASVEGLQFRRAQVLGYGDNPLIQVAYLMADGTPVAFCIMEADGRQAKIEPRTLQSLTTAHWATSSHEFLLIGGPKTDGIAEIAARIRAAL